MSTPTTVRDTADISVEFTPPGGAEFLMVPEVNSVTFPSLTADSREKTTFSSGNTKEFSPGLIDPGTVSMSTMYNPSAVASIALNSALNARSTFQWRISVPEVEIAARSIAANTVAIATTGIPTFAGVSPNLNSRSVGVGVALKVGTAGSEKNYLVSAIDEDGIPTRLTLPTGLNPTQAVTAASYLIVQPAFYVTFVGFLTSFTPSAETDANMTADIEIKVTGSVVNTIAIA